MRNLESITRFFIFIAIIGITVVSCDDPYKTIDYRKLEAEEKALLEDYLALKLDSLVGISIDTIHNKKNGLIYFEMKKGSGDSILPGNVVGFRYFYYELARNDKGEPTLYPWQSNVYSENPLVYNAGNPSGMAFTGIDEGIKKMRKFGKSKMIIPSQIGTNNYFTIVADVEVTYLVNW